jgi:hypothetical protein
MPNEHDDQLLHLNGIDGTTGTYVKPAMTYQQAAAAAKGKPENPTDVSWLRRIWRTLVKVHLGLPFDIDPADVAKAGWGVIFHHEESEEIKNALAPLLEHRRKTVGERVKVLEYCSGERREDWLARYGVAAGSVDPGRVPFYLLLVGSPVRIPFEFYHHLAVEYCVGWIDFDRAEDFSSYVSSLIDYETALTVPNTKEVVFFAPRHAFDRATQLSADYLVKPLAEGAPASGTAGLQPSVAARSGFNTQLFWGQDARKATLAQTLNGISSRPAFLLSASHGMGWPKGHPNQLAAQGALLCQDWPGARGAVSFEHYFAARDLSPTARVHGLIAFLFACYGVGTPEQDRFFHEAGKKPPAIADRSFLAALPKALLSHPKGGALACVGHVERAWGYSIIPPNARAQLQPFENAIGRILSGQPLGLATRDFSERYAALSTTLATKLEKISFNAQVPDYELASAWIARNDAEGYLIFGDPAVRVRVAALGTPR